MAMVERSDARTLRRWFAVGMVVLVLVLIASILWPLALPILWAAILSFLMQPLQVRLTKKFGGRASMAAGVLTGITPVAIFAPLTLIAIAFAQQAATMTTALQQNAELFNLTTWLDSARHPRIAGLVSWVGARSGMEVAELQDYLSTNLKAWAATLAKSSGLIFLNAAGVILQFFLMLFILFFMLRDGASWFRRFVKLLPLSAAAGHSLFTRLGKVLRAVVYGCGLTALVQGALVTIGFAIAGLSGSIVFGVIASVLALLPFGGAALVWVPGVIYLFATGSVGMGIFLLAWGGVVSISDNFIRPIIISRYTPVPTLLVFLGVVGGVAAFGIVGFIIGPVLLVMATELLRFTEGSIARPD